MQGQRCLIYAPLESLSPTVYSCHSTASRVTVTGHFEIRTMNDPKVTLNTIRGIWFNVLKCSKCSKGTPELQISISLVSLYDQSFSSYMPFRDKCSDYPKKDHEHSGVTGVQYTCMLPWYPRAPHFTPFCSLAATFYVQDICKFAFFHWAQC